MTTAAPRPPDPSPSPFGVEELRAEFPALGVELDGRPVAYLDGPGGTQVPQRVIDAVAGYYGTSNANAGGAFLTSERNDAIAAEAHAAVADLLNAASADEIKFGANMTSLTFQVSRAVGATLGPGDEIVVTTLDHDANVAPWRRMAEDRGVTIRTVDVRLDDVTLDLDSLEAALGPRTRLVAVGYASNAVGTINPVAEIVRRAHAVGALTYVDAVHYAPHGPIDVRGLGTDFLACSAYKWFGPHAGLLYGRADHLAALPAYKVRPAHDRWETGTPNFEGMAGTLAAVDYLASIGRRFGDLAPSPGHGPAASLRRRELVAGTTAIGRHERELGGVLLAGLATIRGVKVWGISEPERLDERTPTISITIDGLAPRAAAAALGRAGIFTWDGDFYATGLVERLGLAEAGGLLRLGIVHYTTAGEIERLLGELERLASRPDRVTA